jgi:hypothetical protein
VTRVGLEEAILVERWGVATAGEGGSHGLGTEGVVTVGAGGREQPRFQGRSVWESSHGRP